MEKTAAPGRATAHAMSGESGTDSASATQTLRLLYQDEGMAIVDKPSGIAVHKGLDRSDDNVLKRLNRQLGTWVWPSHRLDRATSGALVFALNEEAASALARAFMEGRAHKTYLAWVRGAPEPREGVIDHPVPRSEESEERLDAITAYRTVAIADDVRTGSPRYGLVVCEPRTGRYHQIRRHMRHVHCPILGDTSYGDNKENKALRAHTGASRSGATRAPRVRGLGSGTGSCLAPRIAAGRPEADDGRDERFGLGKRSPRSTATMVPDDVRIQCQTTVPGMVDEGNSSYGLARNSPRYSHITPSGRSQRVFLVPVPTLSVIVSVMADPSCCGEHPRIE